jgi:hypothetical protein
MLSITDLLNPWPPPSPDILTRNTSADLITRRPVAPEFDASEVCTHIGPSCSQTSPQTCTLPPTSCGYSTQLDPPTLSPPRSHTSSPTRSDQPSVRHHVLLNQKTTLVSLYHHPRGTIIEYPETSSKGSIGHLFEVAPENWSNPRLNFVYSQGPPTGRTKAGDHVRCTLLVDDKGEEVPCREIHATCTFYIIIIMLFR